MHSHVMIYMSCNELHGLYVHVQATMMSTNQVGCKIVIVWVARDLWQRKPTLPSGCALGTRLVYCYKFLVPCNNCYIFNVLKLSFIVSFSAETLADVMCSFGCKTIILSFA